jgi:hypothetical protein
MNASIAIVIFFKVFALLWCQAASPGAQPAGNSVWRRPHKTVLQAGFQLERQVCDCKLLSGQGVPKAKFRNLAAQATLSGAQRFWQRIDTTFCLPNGKHFGNFGGFRVPGKKVVPTSGRQAFDVGVKPLSAPFWMREGRRTAFLSGPPSVFPSCGCSSPHGTDAQWRTSPNGRRSALNQQKRWSEKGDLRKLQRR